MAPTAPRPRALCLAIGGLLARPALALYLASAGDQHEDRKEQPRIYRHLHIPKAAGMSFMDDAHELINGSGFQMESAEGCFSWADESAGALVMLRRPLSHVLSMHSMCARFNHFREDAAPNHTALPNFSDWLGEWDRRMLAPGGWGGDFTPPVEPHTNGKGGYAQEIRDMRIPFWSKPPFKAAPTTLDERDWPVLDGGGTIWHQTKMPYVCFSAINPQVHRMTCQEPQVFPQGGSVTAQAIRNIEKAWFVGVVEHYQTSVCLLEFRLRGNVPLGCNCANPEEWDSFEFHTNNVADPMIPYRALDNKQVVDGDAALYERAWARFVSDAHEVEAKTGMRVLCNETLPAPQVYWS